MASSACGPWSLRVGHLAVTKVSASLANAWVALTLALAEEAGYTGLTEAS